MGQAVHNDRYEDITVQALPSEYGRVCNASYKKWDVRLAFGTWFTSCSSLSHPSHSKPVVGHDVATQAAGHTNSGPATAGVSYASCQTASS